MTNEQPPLPHDDLNEILRQRREKLDKLRDLGIAPYPYRFAKDTAIADVLPDFDTKCENEEHVGPTFAIAGRIHTFRVMGKASFCHVRDETGEMQVYVQRDRVGEQFYEAFRHLFDLGDIIGVRGTVFRTRTGEPTLRAQTVELLSKSLYPLPVVKEREGQVFDAFADKEARYRQRYVDLAVNNEARKIFKVRARVITALRTFLDARGYLEVETPALQPLYGGALARPFTTFYNTLERDFFLRIADELYLKRLLVGGYEKVYEICKDFRNEGMDRYHNPEFTMLEFYQAYADYSDLMDLSEEMFRYVAEAALGTTAVQYQGDTVDFGKPFARKTFYELLKDATGRDLLGCSAAELADVALKHNVEITRQMGEGKILDEMMKTLVRPHLKEPVFIYDYPLSLSPLAKKHRSDPRLVERFQPFALGFELGNAFSELNDPLDQRERFEAQRKLKEAGDEETQPVDEDFLRALECGMPPTGGMGIGVDRLVMLLTDQADIGEVILFPQLAQKRIVGEKLGQAVIGSLKEAGVQLVGERLEQAVIGSLEEAGVPFESYHTFYDPLLRQKMVLSTPDVLFKFGESFVVVGCMSTGEINDQFFEKIESAKELYRQHGILAGIVAVVDKKEFDADTERRILANCLETGVSLLDLREFSRTARWVALGYMWVAGSRIKSLHRPWCHWAHSIANPRFLKENDDIGAEKLGKCCVIPYAMQTP